MQKNWNSFLKLNLLQKKKDKKRNDNFSFLFFLSLSPIHTHTQALVGLLPVASKADEKAHTSHGSEVMQILCPQRPQELWKDLFKYVMHSCDLRFMEIKTTIEKPTPHLFFILPFLLYNKFIEHFMEHPRKQSISILLPRRHKPSVQQILIRLNRIYLGRRQANSAE